MRLDSAHSTVTALRELITSAYVAGGSFGAWLPPPSSLSSTERDLTFQVAKDNAVQECISELVHVAGLPAETEIPRKPTGERKWPDGFVGSLTHKGTVVLGTLAPLSEYSAIGIDLERREDHNDSPLDEHLIAPEGTANGIDRETGTLMAFSAKEAVFKAQFPENRRQLEFSDVVLCWGPSKGTCFHATAALPGQQTLAVRSSVVPPWILCVAFRWNANATLGNEWRIPRV